MTPQNAPATQTRPGADTKERPSVHEPTYLTPTRLLFAVQAVAERVAYRRRRLDESARDLDHAIAEAVDAGATAAELIAYGVSANRAVQAIRDAQ
jgi:hypothetical protein